MSLHRSVSYVLAHTPPKPGPPGEGFRRSTFGIRHSQLKMARLRASEEPLELAYGGVPTAGCESLFRLERSQPSTTISAREEANLGYWISGIGSNDRNYPT
jgi:hypothetical protein